MLVAMVLDNNKEPSVDEDELASNRARITKNSLVFAASAVALFGIPATRKSS